MKAMWCLHILLAPSCNGIITEQEALLPQVKLLKTCCWCATLCLPTGDLLGCLQHEAIPTS